MVKVPKEYGDEKEYGKTHHLLLQSDAEGSQEKTAARKIPDKVINERASKPRSTHMSLLGEIQTDRIRKKPIRESLINGLYILNHMYVHSKTLSSHGVRTYGKLQTIPKKQFVSPAKN